MQLRLVQNNVREVDWEQEVFRHWRKVGRDVAEVTLSGRLFQMVGPDHRQYTVCACRAERATTR